MTAHDWLAHIDPEGEIAGLSAHRRGRLIGRSETWSDRHEMGCDLVRGHGCGGRSA